MAERDKNVPIDTEWFIERIAERSLSINRLARLMERDPGHLYRILHGKMVLSVFDVEPLSDILGVAPAEIIRRATRGRDKIRKKTG